MKFTVAFLMSAASFLATQVDAAPTRDAVNIEPRDFGFGQNKMQDAINKSQQKLQNQAKQAQLKAEQAQKQAQQNAEQAQKQAQQKAEQAKKQAQEQAQQSQQQAKEAQNKVKSQVKQVDDKMNKAMSDTEKDFKQAKAELNMAGGNKDLLNVINKNKEMAKSQQRVLADAEKRQKQQLPNIEKALKNNVNSLEGVNLNAVGIHPQFDIKGMSTEQKQTMTAYAANAEAQSVDVESLKDQSQLDGVPLIKSNVKLDNGNGLTFEEALAQSDLYRNNVNQEDAPISKQFTLSQHDIDLFSRVPGEAIDTWYASYSQEDAAQGKVRPLLSKLRNVQNTQPDWKKSIQMAKANMTHATKNPAHIMDYFNGKTNMQALPKDASKKHWLSTGVHDDKQFTYEQKEYHPVHGVNQDINGTVGSGVLFPIPVEIEFTPFNIFILPATIDPFRYAAWPVAPFLVNGNVIAFRAVWVTTDIIPFIGYNYDTWQHMFRTENGDGTQVMIGTGMFLYNSDNQQTWFSDSPFLRTVVTVVPNDEMMNVNCEGGQSSFFTAFYPDVMVNELMGHGFGVNVPDIAGFWGSQAFIGKSGGKLVIDSMKSGKDMFMFNTYFYTRFITDLYLYGFGNSATAVAWALGIIQEYAPEMLIPPYDYIFSKGQFKGAVIAGPILNYTDTLSRVNNGLWSSHGGVMVWNYASEYADVFEFVNQFTDFWAGVKAYSMWITCKVTTFLGYAGDDVLGYFGGAERLLNPEGALVKRLKENDWVIGNPPDVPIYVMGATHDEYTDIKNIDNMVDQYCERGMKVYYVREPKKTHLDLLSIVRSYVPTFFDALSDQPEWVWHPALDRNNTRIPHKECKNWQDALYHN